MTEERTHGADSAINDDLPAAPAPVRITPRAIELIEQICREEGAQITLTGSNPDSNGLPNEAVILCNDDTAWQQRIIRRDTVEAALQAAVEYRGDSPEEARRLITELADHLEGAMGASTRVGTDTHSLWYRAQRFLGEIN